MVDAVSMELSRAIFDDANERWPSYGDRWRRCFLDSSSPRTIVRQLPAVSMTAKPSKYASLLGIPVIQAASTDVTTTASAR